MLTNSYGTILGGNFSGCKVTETLIGNDITAPGFYITEECNNESSEYCCYIYYNNQMYKLIPNNICMCELSENLFYKIGFGRRSWVLTVLKRMYRYDEFVQDIVGDFNMYEILDLHCCNICGVYHVASSGYISNNTWICDDCFNSHYYFCNRCRDLVKKEEADITKDGNYLCPNCAKREYILPYHHYYPNVKFYGDYHNNSVPYLGVELEVDNGGEKNISAKIVVNTMNKEGENFVYCSHDGSLNNGFEIITQPATLEYHTSIKNIYQEAFKRLRKMEYLSHDTTTCGFHVHFNRSFFGDNETENIGKLIYLVNHFWNKFVIFARRPEFRMNHYSKKIDMDTKEYIIEANKTGLHEYHYYAINIANPDTIEFRMFKGTLNVNTFLATLQFVHNCIIAAREKSVSEIHDMKFEELVKERNVKKYWKRRIEVDGTEE